MRVGRLTSDMFSIVAFKTLDISHVATSDTWCVVGSLVIVLLQILSWFWQ